MSRISRFLSAGILLLIPALLLSGCGKSEETEDERLLRETDEARQQQFREIFSDEIRSLSEAELAALPARNTLPTETIIPNALSVRVVQPERFLLYADADKVIRFFGNSPSMVPFWNQFDQLDLIITSTKVAPVSLLDPQSGEEVGENYPLPCTAVYAKKKSAVDREAFLDAQFGKLPKSQVHSVEWGGRRVTFAENSLIVPLDASGKSTARIDGIATAVAFPTENEALAVTGPIDSVEKFFNAGDGESRGVLAQRVGRVATDNFDFAFFYDYSSPQKEAITLPVPPDLAMTLLENARFLLFTVNASATEGTDALRLEIAADDSPRLDKIDESLGNTLLQIHELLGAATDRQEEGEAADAKNGSMTPLLQPLSDAIRALTKERQGNRIVAAMAMSPERAELFGKLVDQANLMADLSAKNGRRAMTARNLKFVGDILNAYYAKNNSFPPLAITGTGGTPLLSWRVALLPFMGPEGEQLYNEFHLDEPWDSENNIKLLGRIPAVYRSPLLTDGGGKTLFRIFSGTGTPRNMIGEPAKMQNFENPGKTFLAVAVAPEQAVEWTRPDELAFDPERFGEIFGDFVLAVPVMGEIFTAPFSGAPDEVKALSSWISGTPEESPSAEEGAEPSVPGPESNTSPLEN